MKPIASLTLSVALALLPTLARGQEAWPIRSVTFIIPYAAGGDTHLVGRLAARYGGRALGKPVIVDNRSGAGGIVGTHALGKAGPAGYVLCGCTGRAVFIAPFA